jgi:hypothetical protein
MADTLRPMAGKKVRMSAKWQPAAARRPRSTGRNRCLAVIETARGKVGNGGPLSQLDVTASVQRTPASREARLRCNLSIAPPQRSVRVSSQNQYRQGVPQDWYRRAVKSPLGSVFDFIVVFTTLMTCLRLYLVGTTKLESRSAPYSTVTLFARFRGLSTSVPRAQAVW